jgi:DNA-binding GntR family transcriptional regulator
LTLSRAVLREQIRELLLERILNGEYQPGHRLVELQIAHELGTSQAPVREALRELESLRFVESEPYRGTRVREITEEELAEIYPVRAALEELAARQAAAHLDGDVAALEAEYEAMLRAADKGDLSDQVQHDVRFHCLIVEAAGNRILLDVWKSLRVEARTVVTVIKADVDLRKLAEMHKPLLDALAERNPEKASRALRWHFESFKEMMLEGVRR